MSLASLGMWENLPEGLNGKDISTILQDSTPSKLNTKLEEFMNRVKQMTFIENNICDYFELKTALDAEISRISERQARLVEVLPHLYVQKCATGLQRLMEALMPEILSTVDGLEAKGGTVLTQTETLRDEIKRLIHEDKRKRKLQKRHSVQSELQKTKNGFKDTLMGFMALAEKTMVLLMPNTLYEGLMSEESMREVLHQTDGANKSKPPPSLSSRIQKVLDSQFDELCDAYSELCTLATAIKRMQRRLSADVTADGGDSDDSSDAGDAAGKWNPQRGVPKQLTLEDWSSLLYEVEEDTWEGCLPLDNSLIVDRFKRDSTWTVLLMKEMYLFSLKTCVQNRAAGGKEASSAPPISLKTFKTFDTCCMTEEFFRIAFTVLRRATREYCSARLSHILALSEQTTFLSSCHQYGNVLTTVAESLADAVQTLSEIILPSDGHQLDYSLKIFSLVTLRTLSDLHCEFAAKILVNYNSKFALTLPVDAQSVPIIQASVDLNRQALMIMSYMNKLATIVVDDGHHTNLTDAAFRHNISRCEQTTFGMSGSAIETMDARNGLNVKFAGLYDQRISLMGHILSVEAQFLRHGLERAFEMDEVTLDDPQLSDKIHQFTLKLKPPQPSGSGASAGSINWKLLESLIEQMPDELLSAIDSASTLPDDVCFLLNESLTRIIQSGDIQGVCADVNHVASIILNLLEEMEQRAMKSCPLFIRVFITEMKRPEGEESGTERSPGIFRVRKLCLNVTETSFNDRKLSSAESLPHALNNFIYALDYIPRLQTRVYEANAALPAGLAESSDDKLLQSASQTFDEVMSQAKSAFTRCLNTIANEITDKLIWPPIDQRLKTFRWDLTTNEYADEQSSDSLSDTILLTMGILEREFDLIMPKDLLDHLWVHLSDALMTRLFRVISEACSELTSSATAGIGNAEEAGRGAYQMLMNPMEFRIFNVSAQQQDSHTYPTKPSGPKTRRGITCLGALEIDRSVRTMLQWFMERTEQNLRTRHSKISEICDILSIQSISELWDLCATGSRKWEIDLQMLKQLLTSRIDLFQDDSELEQFFQHVERHEIFKPSNS